MPQTCGCDHQESSLVSEQMLASVFTIGHSTHPQEHLIALLQQHDITAVCDVRSKPYSRMNPQFNREELEKALLARGIAYRFLGKELGARSDDPSCYEGGKVKYDRLAETDLFKRGLKRIIRGLKENFRIALMCAEKEPLECHRAILIARYLTSLGIHVLHIHADGHLETHEDALSRLAGMLNLPESHMFSSREELLADAYRRQEERIAYAPTQDGNATVENGAA
jgi:uncharacterized protein (DUF488 family)